MEGVGVAQRGAQFDAAAGKAQSTSIATNAAETSVTAGVASKTSGLMYMEAGSTYKFTGVGDDSLAVVVGGKDVASTTWGAAVRMSVTSNATPTKPTTS